MMKLEDLKTYQTLKSKASPLATKCEELVDLVDEILSGISGCHKNFTMHDIGHSFRVAAYMEQLAFGINYEKIELFNDLELAIIVMSAILHDIGMFFTEDEAEEIKNCKKPFKKGFTFEGISNALQKNEDEAVKEIIRLCHAERVEKFIERDDFKTILEINNYSFADKISQICKAHGEEKSFVESLSKSYTISKYEFNIQYFAELLRIADYLDLDKERTPILWYKLVGPKGYSDIEWRKHFSIHNEIKLQKTYDNKMQIYFNGASSDAKIHRNFLKYIDDLKSEIEFADNILNIKDQKEQYRLNLLLKIDNKVETEGFTYSDLRLSLNYRAITELLMGKNIYGDNRYGLRELVQNAIDACKIMKEISKSRVEFADYTPIIKIHLSKKENYVKILDNGIGMSLETIRKHFLNIGNSYYTSKEFRFNNYLYRPIGKFGIGFLACFLLSNSVKIKSQKYDDPQVNAIELEKNSEYVVTKIDKNITFKGTEITLDFDTFFHSFKSKERLLCFLEDMFFTDVRICVHDIDENDVTYIKSSDEKIADFENSFSNEALVPIDFNRYSKNIEGIMAVEYRKTSLLRNLDAEKSLFYVDGEFMPLSVEKIENKTYALIYYADFSNDEIEQLRKEKDVGRFKNCAIALAKKMKKLYCLFVDVKKISYAARDIAIDENFQFAHDILIDNIHIKEFIEKLGHNYYEELNYFTDQPVFICRGKYFQLQSYSLDTRYYISKRKSDRQLLQKFYSKDVLIPYCRISFSLPMKIDVVGFLLDNKDIEVALDVSRYRIIGGIRELKVEITLALMRSLIERVSVKSKPYIEEYIIYLQTIKDGMLN